MDSSSAAVHRAASLAQMATWRADGACRDLVAIRPLSAFGTAAYILFDDAVTCAARARLRMNRSYLHHSQHRRHLRPSARCSCGDDDETVAHLLVCSNYAHLHGALRAVPFVFDASLLMGEVSWLRRSRHRRLALQIGGAFFRSLCEFRPRGI